MSRRLEVTGAKEFVGDLKDARKQMRKELRSIVETGAHNIKDDWKASWKSQFAGRSRVRHIAESINYDLDVHYGGLVAVAVIGALKKRFDEKSIKPQGSLAHLIEFGAPHWPGTVFNRPRPGMMPAFDAEEPRFNAYFDAHVASWRLFRRGV